MKFLSNLKRILVTRLARLITPELEKVVESQLVQYNHNLVYTIERLEAEKTARFIMENVPVNFIFKDRFALLSEACRLLKASGKESGVILEFGVYKGSTINHISSLMKNISFYGFDSFEGLTEPWVYHGKRAFSNVGGIPKVNPNVKLVKGYFKDTLPSFMKKLDEEVIMIHVDSDLYSSCKTIFDSLKSYLKPGLIIVFDEFFNYTGWENGEYKAWNELVDELQLKYDYVGFTYQRTPKFRSAQQLAVILK